MSEWLLCSVCGFLILFLNASMCCYGALEHGGYALLTNATCMDEPGLYFKYLHIKSEVLQLVIYDSPGEDHTPFIAHNQQS